LLTGVDIHGCEENRIVSSNAFGEKTKAVLTRCTTNLYYSKPAYKFGLKDAPTEAMSMTAPTFKEIAPLLEETGRDGLISCRRFIVKNHDST
jgi:hypothetical protein